MQGDEYAGASVLRTGGPPSGLGCSPRCRSAPSRLRRGVGRQSRLGGTIFSPAWRGAEDCLPTPSILCIRENRFLQFLFSPPRSGAPMRLRCEGATTRERQASDFGAHLRRRGCAPGSPPHPGYDLHDTGVRRKPGARGNHREVVPPPRILIYYLSNLIYTVNREKKHYIIDIRSWTSIPS